VDYGTDAMVRDPQTRKYRRTRLFVMVLGCSRKAARFLTFRSSSRIWAELHEKPFRRLGGATRVVVLGLRLGIKLIGCWRLIVLRAYLLRIGLRSCGGCRQRLLENLFYRFLGRIRARYCIL